MFDIIFISYNEENADQNWKNLKERFHHAKRVHGVNGIHAAHKAAAKLSFTKMFWVVDGDAEIINSFNFVKEVKEYDTVFVYRSINPVNSLIYGYGGVKLLPKLLVLKMDENTVDMTTSISDKFKLEEEVANITKFNTSPFSAWKSAFRECCKLSSQLIKNHNRHESEERLKIWTTVNNNADFGDYAIAGAIAGKEYGLQYSNNEDEIKKINDFKWLANTFDATYNKR